MNKQNLGKTKVWNPWVGCSKVSEACLNCNVDCTKPFKFEGYNFIPRRYPEKGSVILVTLLSDFFIEEADPYREGAWDFIKQHPNLIFLIITKRVDRISGCLPSDWGTGYNNVILSATIENNKRAVERLPIFKQIPAKHKWLSVAPLLEDLNLFDYLVEGWIEHIEVLGEKLFIQCNSETIRACKYEWIKKLSDQCRDLNIRFSVLVCGHKFIYNEETYSDNSACYYSKLADSLNLDVVIPITFELQGLTKII